MGYNEAGVLCTNAYSQRKLQPTAEESFYQVPSCNSHTSTLPRMSLKASFAAN